MKDRVPAGRFEYQFPEGTEYEQIDMVASIVLKQKHKRFGGWMKRLAAFVKKHYTQKGSWQALWTIATRVFGLAYRGWSLEACKGLATTLARELNVPEDVAEALAEDIYKNKAEILGERQARPEVAEALP